MEVTIIKDSTCRRGIRLTTMHLRYWRPIHAELMTHRVFTRNARSSRAVPVTTLLSEDIFVPKFMKNKPGMQATQELPHEDYDEAVAIWEDLAEHCRIAAKDLAELGVHKQWANRPLEWFGWIDVLVSSTYWENFWALRLDETAQPELRMLAELMLKKMQESTPQLLLPGQWHLPYVTDDEVPMFELDTLIKLSTARCARLSYKPFDGQANLEAEIERYSKLVVSQPVHASPAEHQATPDKYFGLDDKLRPMWEFPDQHGNFYGWRQHRKMIPNEAVMEW